MVLKLNPLWRTGDLDIPGVVYGGVQPVLQVLVLQGVQPEGEGSPLRPPARHLGQGAMTVPV